MSELSSNPPRRAKRTKRSQDPPRRTCPLQYVKGVGPKRAEALNEYGIHSVHDLLFYFPRGYLDRSTIIPINELDRHIESENPVTVIAQVFRREVRYTRKKNKLIFILTVKDETGFLTCVWFENARWFKDAFEIGELLALSKHPERDKYGRMQFTHPEFDRLRGALEEDEPDWGKLFNTGAIIPKYSSNSSLSGVGLDSRGFRRIIRQALNHRLGEVSETLSADIVHRLKLVDLQTALKEIHFPESHESLNQASERLKFDEFFYLQILMALRRKQNREERKGISYERESPSAQKLVHSLPFTLTSAQQRVVKEILDDMTSSRPMNRLLQGDVGSGKTIVALLASLVAVDSGYQVAFMAPTEILAEQHFRSIKEFTEDLSINVRLLVGGQKKKLREDILEDLRRGSANIVVGTHALIEEDVSFHQLGLVVIDEQHRFGVLQRNELRNKGLHPDVLVMTATPIPRTLSMTLYGDLDVSVIDEMPSNRKPVRTAIRMEHQKEKVYEFIRSEVEQGRQAYIVFPLIEESEKLDLKAATVEFAHLQKKFFPEFHLGLLHGRMSSEEKDEVMMKFKRGEIQILASTTVIEVGIDVPNASVMLIENAERFGLSQLHQLRGRVGRGADQSYAILMANYGWFDGKRGLTKQEAKKEIEKAKVRLETMVETTDGFRLAEVDLALRGPGEIFGTRQSGIPELRIADPLKDLHLLTIARDEAFKLIDSDPQLVDPANINISDHFQKQHKDLLQMGNVG